MFKLNDAVLHLVIEFDAPLGKRRFKLSLEGANRCGQLVNLIANDVGHIEGFLCGLYGGACASALAGCDRPADSMSSSAIRRASGRKLCGYGLTAFPDSGNGSQP